MTGQEASVRYVKADVVASQIGLSVGHIRLLAHAGEIPSRRAPGRRFWLFREDHIAEWLDGVALATQELPAGGRITEPVYGAERQALRAIQGGQA